MSPYVGIFGAGQLSRMLAQAAQKLGVKVEVLATKDEEPASFIAPTRVLDLKDASAVYSFVKDKSHLLFENEFLDCAFLREATAEKAKDFYPSLQSLESLQDKLHQKRIFMEAGLPTASFGVLEEGKDIKSFLDESFQTYPKGFVLKWSRLGYDGKGVMILPLRSKILWAEAEAFIREGQRRGAQIYIENKVPFSHELAKIFIYSTSGDFQAYPLVQSTQKFGLCFEVQGPAISLGVDPQLEALAHNYGKILAEKFKIYGAFALEFFLEKKTQRLLINELAPRVHNSGHYSQDAATCSQFENHLRAVLGLPLGSTDCAAYFSMLNIIGPPDFQPRQNGIHFRPPSTAQNIKIHWYQKKEIRPLRKLGHINGWTKDGGNANTLQAKLALDLERVQKEIIQNG